MKDGRYRRGYDSEGFLIETCRTEIQFFISSWSLFKRQG